MAIRPGPTTTTTDGWICSWLAARYGNEASQLWHNNGDGTFTEITTGSLVTDLAQSEGAAWGDYDNDGFMDLFVARGYVNGKNALYHNNGNSNAWLKVKLEGTTSNRSAIGAKVKVRATINGTNFLADARDSGRQPLPGRFARQLRPWERERREHAPHRVALGCGAGVSERGGQPDPHCLGTADPVRCRACGRGV